MTTPSLTIRAALASDLPHIVHLLSDDPLGALRENPSDPLPGSYHRAFEAIEQDDNNELIVIEGATGVPVGVLQLTFTPYMTHQGAWRATIEGVRVDRDSRGRGLGGQLVAWAISRAQDRGCDLVQLTTDRQRPKAIRFYESMGFVASHVGMKLKLTGVPSVVA